MMISVTTKSNYASRLCIIWIPSKSILVKENQKPEAM